MKINPHGYPSFLKTYTGETRNWEGIQIPPEFVNAHKKSFGEGTWVLKVGSETCYVKIKRRGREYFFRRSDWVEFAKHHDLRYGDQVMFFLVGKSEFEVLLYSRTTCCQILPPSQPELAANASPDDQEIGASRNIKKPKRKPISRKYEVRKKPKCSGHETVVKVKSENLDIPSETEAAEESSDPECENRQEGVQKRKYSRFSTVNVEAGNPYFEMVVKKSHEMFMTVPMEFARRTGIIREKIIKLLTDQNREPELIEVSSSENRVRLTNGWKSFKDDNKIEEGDRCSFTLVNPNSREIMCLSVKKLRQ